jgi:hypothetical protein
MTEPGLCNRCKGVDAKDRLVTCTMLEGGPCSACEEMEVIYDQIEQLEEEITKLTAKQRTLASRMNAIHDPFIHKLSPEIGSHIFRLCLPTLDDNGRDLRDEGKEVTRVLRLGAVCQKWRQLAWATPNLWELLYVNIGPPTERSLVESLPGLVREWLSRSGMLPLTIFFQQFEDGDNSPSYTDSSDEFVVKTLEHATDEVVHIINLHSGRWRNLHLDVAANIPERLCGSIQPDQLFALKLRIEGERSLTQKFVMKSKPSPTHLTLHNFAPTSIDIVWDNVTCVDLQGVSVSECLELLQLAPALEYFLAIPEEDNPTISVDTITLHPRLRSLKYSYEGTQFFEAIKVPSLEEWTRDAGGDPLSVISMVSLLQRSGCNLKILNLVCVPLTTTNFRLLLQAIPSLEYLELYISQDRSHKGEMDDIFTRIFRSSFVTSAIPPEETTRESFLPRLQFLYCAGDNPKLAPFSWDRIPQLYYQGHRRSLTLESIVYESHISDEVAHQLLQLANEGVDLRLLDRTTKGGGDFLENFVTKLSSFSSTEL